MATSRRLPPGGVVVLCVSLPLWATNSDPYREGGAKNVPKVLR